MPLVQRLNRLLWELGQPEVKLGEPIPDAVKKVADLLQIRFASIRQVVEAAELVLGISEADAPEDTTSGGPATSRASNEARPEPSDAPHSPAAPTPDPPPGELPPSPLRPDRSTNSGPDHFRVLPATSTASPEAGPEHSDVPTFEGGGASRRRWGRQRDEQGASHNAREDLDLRRPPTTSRALRAQSGPTTTNSQSGSLRKRGGLPPSGGNHHVGDLRSRGTQSGGRTTTKIGRAMKRRVLPLQQRRRHTRTQRKNTSQPRKV